MKKIVMISVCGEQYFEDVDPDKTELVTEGTLEETCAGFLLSYEESELTGMSGTTTTFELRGSAVILTRAGSVRSRMEFEQGLLHQSLYETPYGDMTVDVNTQLLENGITEAGGSLCIEYTIAVNGAVTGRNCFKITVREK